MIIQVFNRRKDMNINIKSKLIDFIVGTLETSGIIGGFFILISPFLLMIILINKFRRYFKFY